MREKAAEEEGDKGEAGQEGDKRGTADIKGEREIEPAAYTDINKSSKINAKNAWLWLKKKSQSWCKEIIDFFMTLMSFSWYQFRALIGYQFCFFPN